jgi:hypothetical protein
MGKCWTKLPVQHQKNLNTGTGSIPYFSIACDYFDDTRAKTSRTFRTGRGRKIAARQQADSTAFKWTPGASAWVHSRASGLPGPETTFKYLSRLPM